MALELNLVTGSSGENTFRFVGIPGVETGL